jgi:hypothetical protein
MWQLLFAHVLAASPEPVPWARSVEGDVVRLAIVGSLPDVADPWADAVRAAEPDLVLFTGVDRDDVLTGWPSDHGVLAMAAGVPTKAYLARFPGIGGDLPNATPYGWVDLVVGGIRWRVVYVTAADRPIARWEEQLWWLPRALERSAYDRLIVVSDAPRHTLSDRDPSPGARMLLDAVQEAADPMAFALFVAGNTGTNEVFTPGGRFGELHLVAGASGGRREGHHREGQGMPGRAGPRASGAELAGRVGARSGRSTVVPVAGGLLDPGASGRTRRARVPRAR